MVCNGKILIINFSEKEEQLCKKVIQWLSDELDITIVPIKQQMNNFRIDPLTRTYVKNTGETVYLTAKQFDLLYFLFSHRGQVFTKEQIYENVWGYDNAPDASNLSSFIRKLRLKIEPYPDNPRYIITVWGVGYKFSEKEKP
mgnify:FL=1